MEHKKIISQLMTIILSNRLSYNQFNQLCKIARKNVNLQSDKKGKHLPQLLTDAELQKFYEVIEKDENFRNITLLKLLFYTGLRVSEILNIEKNQVNLHETKIFVQEGKGSKDRYVLFPESFKLVLMAYLRTIPNNRWLFESNQKRKMSSRRVQQLVHEYQYLAGIDTRVHPHLLRHQLLTYLTKNKLTDGQIQLISGHVSKKSLEVYQHMGLQDVQKDYQEAMKGVNI